ncbi:MAG TPA: dihydrofolate reductase [Ignavibacteriaceae bacterium]|nr:MAG: diacylglycerol kinase [Ignavibacteria bacterium RBG_16_35_7]
MKIILIAAVAKNNVIGRSTGEMPWHSKEDFQHFKQTTFGFPIIMGRKSFESLGKPLKGRLNIILTKNSKLKEKFEEIMIFNSLEQAYEYCDVANNEKIFVIGGGQIFKQAINNADEMIISHMDFDAKGDVVFPKIDLSKWKISSREKRSEFEIVTYVRKK